MSTIEKMQIQGIRSYGPKDQDTQIIEFFTPVTLIVGQNGSGKTTIIECLKYATTSDMPPNTKGVSFIFDPKLIDEVETKARLKLNFKDTSGLGVQVHKNMCVTQKAKKLEFRTLETIITRYDENGKTKSTITSKCINADAEVINALGVSKAVLEHVIFCHQEDSNWPLSDAKTLKTRFDEIFAATKYIKALETLRKVRLEKQALIRQMEVERKHLEGYKNRSTQLERDMNECMGKLDTFKSRREEIQAKIAPIDKQLEYFMQETAKIVELKQELDKIESEKALIEKQIKELLIATKDCLFSGTDAELKEYVQEYNAKTDKMRKEEEEATAIKIRQLGEKLKQLSAQKNKINLELGSMENKSTVCTNQKVQLEEMKKRATSLADREDVNDETTLGVYISAYEDETRKIEDKSRSALTQIESRIEQARDQKSKIDQNILNKTDLVKKNKAQLEKIEEELAIIDNDKVQIELSKKIKESEAEIAKEQSESDDVERLREEIDEAEREQSRLKTKQNQLDERIAKWHLNSKAKTEIDMMRAEKRSKQDQIRRKKKGMEEELEKFFDMSKNENIRDEITDDERLKPVYEQECRELITEMNSNEERRKEVEKRLCSAELRRKMLSEEMKTKEKRSRECEEDLVRAMGVEDDSELDRYESTLEQLENEFKTLLDEKGFLNGVDKTYKRFLTQLQQQQKAQSDHSCPVCMRCFKDERELTDTVAELKKYTSKLPQKMIDLETKLNNTQTKLDRMRESKSTKEEYDRLRNKDLPEIKSQVEQIDKETLGKLKKELREIEETRTRLQERKSYADQIQTDVILIDKLATECSEIERRIDTATKVLPVDAAGADLSSLNEEKKQINDEINRISEAISSKRERTNQCYKRRDRINGLKERLNEMKTRRNELEMRAQKKTSLSEKRVELGEEIEEAEAECARLGELLKQSVRALSELQRERENALTEQRTTIEKRRRACDELKQLSARLVEISRAVEKFENDELPRLEKLRKEVKAIDQEEKQVQSDLEKSRRQQDEIRTELARQELKKRELNDNLRLREKRAEHEAKKKQYTEKLDQVNARGVNVDLRTFNQEQKRIESQREQLRRELNEVHSNELTLEGRLHGIRDEMALETHKNALQKYLMCLADLKVLEISVVDIEKYYKALDRAIMNYHMMKMSAINKIIKQLWRQVYRGTDIDHVEIRSEEEEAGADGGLEKEVSLKSRRTYTYRVVMVKGDTVLDMRGRCSAGQKVLASIIIRLALAETFCLNSGILTLDEPTTNLDRENIESLASALVEIIKSRSAQRNFQLIIITHDEDFVEMLGRSEFMDQYYRVQKDDNGFSRITRRSNEHF